MAKQTKKRHVARRALAAAACLLLIAGVTVMTIPSARAAVTEWISGWFSTDRYFNEEKESRPNEPAIEAIIISADKADIEILEVGPRGQAYADAFTLTFDEIAYDGDCVYITGTMPGPVARPFVQACSTGGDTYRCAVNDGSLGGDADAPYYFFYCENTIVLTLEDGSRFWGEIWPTFTEEMDALTRSIPQEERGVPVFENGEFVTTCARADALWDAYLADHDVRFSIECFPDDPDAPLTGLTTGEVTLRMRYDNVESEPPEMFLEAGLGRVTIDANAHVAGTTQASVNISQPLGGVHPVTVQEWQPRTGDEIEIYTYTKELDFAGAMVTVKEISFTPTDTELTMRVVLPDSFTQEELRAALTFHFLLDGERMPGGLYGGGWRAPDDGETLAAQGFDHRFRDSHIPPSRWASAKTLTIIPTTVYWWDMQVGVMGGPETPFSLRDGAVHTAKSSSDRWNSWNYDEQYDEMTEYAITIELDKYR